MSDEPDNLVLVYLRRMEVKLDKVADDMSDVRRRVTSLEGAVSLLHGDFSGQSLRMDRVDARLDRIERRIDLTAA